MELRRFKKNEDCNHEGILHNGIREFRIRVQWGRRARLSDAARCSRGNGSPGGKKKTNEKKHRGRLHDHDDADDRTRTTVLMRMKQPATMTKPA